MAVKLTRREQNLLITGGTVIFIILFFVLVLQPKWDLYRGNQAKAADLLKKIDVLKADRAKRLAAKTESVETLKSQIRGFRSQLPVYMDTASFVNFLIAAADTSKANLVEVSINESIVDELTKADEANGEKKEKAEKDKDKKAKKEENKEKTIEGTITFPINVQVNGSYSQVREFIKQVEKLKRLNHINELKIVKNELTGDVNGYLTLDVYSWSKGDPLLNDPLTVLKSEQPGKKDPFGSVSPSVLPNFDRRLNIDWNNFE